MITTLVLEAKDPEMDAVDRMDPPQQGEVSRMNQVRSRRSMKNIWNKPWPCGGAA